MRHARSIFTLPSALLLLLVAVPPCPVASEPSWPYNLPADAKYFPEDEVDVKRNAKVMERLASETPIGVRKMSGDEGEMFFLDYWQFHGAGLADESGGLKVADKQLLRRATQESDREEYGNSSLAYQYLPPFLLHSEQPLQYEHPFRFLPRNGLRGRDFQCPTGTSSCAAISRPNSCCTTGETCVVVTDTGLGDVGCCPAGTSCSGSVSTCDTANGYTSCPGSSNGGCCIPNYDCEDVGCIISGTRTVTTTLPVATSTIRPSTSSTSRPSSSTTSPSATPTTSSPPSIILTPTTAPIIVQSPLSCTPGFQSCPQSLGGGCCPTDRACGSPSCPPLSTTPTATAAAPVRPTSGTSSEADDTIVPVTLSTAANTETIPTAAGSAGPCPTGYYMCSAYYLGGCCQVGRDCAQTSCPPSPGTVVVSNGVTVAAPAGATVAAASVSAGSSNSGATTGITSSAAASAGAGSCATGWYSCAADRGGGCCPSGYNCAENCVATVSGAGSVGKLAPVSAGTGVRAWWWGFCVAGVVAGFGMVVL